MINFEFFKELCREIFGELGGGFFEGACARGRKWYYYKISVQVSGAVERDLFFYFEEKSWVFNGEDVFYFYLVGLEEGPPGRIVVDLVSLGVFNRMVIVDLGHPDSISDCKEFVRRWVSG